MSALPGEVAAESAEPQDRLPRSFLIFLSVFCLASLVLVVPLVASLFQAGIPIIVTLAVSAQTLLALSDPAWDITLQLTAGLRRTAALERLDFGTGIPADCKTLVVVPVLIYPDTDVHALWEALEQRHAVNRDGNLTFCLLTDFSDVTADPADSDALMLAELRAGVDSLNAKEDEFIWLHRSREWDSVERMWMGSERKRGKIHALNSFLLNLSTSPFSVVRGDRARLVGTRYVIVLDQDTQLPPGVASELISLMAHPRNRAQIDQETNVVRRGHGVIQPLPWVAPPNLSSRLQRLAGSDDPPRTDLYQALAGQGSFYGKGIYDLATFHRVLHNRFPEKLILSHDLLEGAYLRSAIAESVLIPETHPRTYRADARRRHRWTRGDWQNYQWLLAKVPTGASEREKNPLDAVARWKIFDNLRRTTVAASLTVATVFGMCENMAPLWWIVLFGAHLLAVLAQTMGLLVRREVNSARGIGSFFATQTLKKAVGFSLAPYEAVNSLDAYARSMWRMHISKRRLLEWTPSNETQKGEMSLLDYLWMLRVAPALSATAGALLFATHTFSEVAGVVLAMWCASPLVAWALDQPGGKALTSKEA